MASIISAGTTSGTALNMTADTSGSLQLATGASATTAVTIDASQNVTLNNVIPSGSTAPTNGMFLPAANTVGLSTASTERMRIDSSGVLMLGKTSQNTNTTGIEIQQDGFTGITRASNTPLYVNRKTTTGNMISFYSDATNVGNISNNGTNTTYGTSSDYRLKDNIIPMTDALDTVSKLKPVTYKWKSTNQAGQGFIAHELQEIVPDCVVGEKDAVDKENNPIYQGVDTSFLVATLTAAIQELTERVKALESK